MSVGYGRICLKCGRERGYQQGCCDIDAKQAIDTSGLAELSKHLTLQDFIEWAQKLPADIRNSEIEFIDIHRPNSHFGITVRLEPDNAGQARVKIT